MIWKSERDPDLIRTGHLPRSPLTSGMPNLLAYLSCVRSVALSRPNWSRRFTAAAQNPDCHDAKDARRRARADRASFAGRVPRAGYMAPRLRSACGGGPRGGDINEAVIAPRLVLQA